MNRKGNSIHPRIAQPIFRRRRRLLSNFTPIRAAEQRDDMDVVPHTTNAVYSGTAAYTSVISNPHAIAANVHSEPINSPEEDDEDHHQNIMALRDGDGMANDVVAILGLDDRPQHVNEEDHRSDDDANITPLTALLQWNDIFSLLCVCGSVRLTADQHALLRITMMWCTPGQVIPSYRKVRRVLFPFLLEQCFPRSEIFEFPIGETPTQCDGEQDLNDNGVGLSAAQGKAKVRITLPTEWAKLDVITYPIYDAMFPDTNEDLHGHCSRYWSLSNCDIVQNEADLLLPTRTITVDSDSGRTGARRGDKISITMSQLPRQVQDELFHTSFDVTCLDRGQLQLRGNIIHV